MNDIGRCAVRTLQLLQAGVSPHIGTGGSANYVTGAIYAVDGGATAG